MESVLAAVESLLQQASVACAIIGGHAVNAWVEPRITGNVDVTVHADASGIDRLRQILISAGYAIAREHGANLPSGPDFVRFVSSDGVIVIEIQSAKTVFQSEVVRRAGLHGGPRVATPEDLIILKLIANRPKDQVDLLSLCALPGLDWPYVEQWARAWEVLGTLQRLRGNP